MNLQEMIDRRNAIYATEIDAAPNDAALDALQTELRKLDLLIAEAQRNAPPAAPTPTAAPVIPQETERTQVVTGAVPGVVTAGVQTQQRDQDTEYRKAFMRFVTRGTPIPAELRDDENTLTSDVATAIPTVVVDRIIETMESIGMILPLVTHTSYASGVQIPTSTVKPVATFVNEGASSDRQKKTTSYVTFSKFKLRCEISMTMETSVMALSAFEAAFTRQVAEAMVKAIEGKIISTDVGTANNRGILAETPETGQALTAKTLSYESLLAAEAALPSEYEGDAVWCMTKKTYLAYMGITDANGQPIARVNYGLSAKPERVLLGRPVVLCNTGYLDTFSSSLEAGKIFAFIFNFKDYVLNTVYDMGIQRKQDWDTEDMLTKAVMSVDGKVIDKNSLVTIAKA